MAQHHDRTTLEEKAILTLLLKEHDVHAFDDLPSGILASFGIFWTILAALFWIFFAADTGSRFAITVAILFIGFFFSVPAVMARQAKPRLERPVDTLMIWTGPRGPDIADPGCPDIGNLCDGRDQAGGDLSPSLRSVWTARPLRPGC